jgi:hypothetical protein
MSLSDRTFGVEIECNLRMGDNRYDFVEEVLSEEGLDWEVKEDGSLPWNTGIEVATSILSGEDGMNELEKGFQILNRIGAWADNSCGMHVHHGIPEIVDPLYSGIEDDQWKRELMKIVRSWYENQEDIYKMVASRRRNGIYCREWNQTHLDRYERQLFQLGYTSFGRLNLGLDSIENHGTIELRIHEGTLNFEHAKAWVTFGQKFIESCLTRKHVIKRGKTENLFRRIRVPKTEAMTLEQKIRSLDPLNR